MVENSIAEHFDAENSDDLQCVVFSKSYNSGDAEKIAKAEKLLVEVHDGIYVQHFPLEDEQEPVDVWKGMLSPATRREDTSMWLSEKVWTPSIRKLWVLWPPVCTEQTVR